MVCPNCGAALENYDAFCPGCGKTIQKNPDGTLTAVDVKSTEPVEAPPKKVAKRLYPPEEPGIPGDRGIGSGTPARPQRIRINTGNSEAGTTK